MPVQGTLWAEPGNPRESLAADPFAYDHVIVAFSGGKDSLACLLLLLDLGVPKEKIELWHHDVDGREGSTLVDWPVTRAYCSAIAGAFGLPVYFSWRTGGFEREMNRENSLTAPVQFETPDGVLAAGGVRGTMSTRRKFPQVSADLKTRWCSAYLKIDVCSTAITNQERFHGKKTLLVTGERAQESTSRARYCGFEPHKTSGLRRTVDQWRPVHKWDEAEVWAIIEKHRVNPHPAYRLGWGRVSCAACIFGSPDQWATLSAIAPRMVQRIAEYETQFGVTIQRGETVMERVGRGRPYANLDPDVVAAALSCAFTEPVFLDKWTLPAGAFGEGAGPT